MDISPKSPPMTIFGPWSLCESQVRRCRLCSQLQAPCLSQFCSLCHCFPSCLAYSEHRTFWGLLASVPLGQGSAQQGSDTSWTPSMLYTMGAPQREQDSCTHTAPPCTYLPWDGFIDCSSMQSASQACFSPCTSFCCLICMFDTICISPSSWLLQQPPHYMK